MEFVFGDGQAVCMIHKLYSVLVLIAMAGGGTVCGILGVNPMHSTSQNIILL